MKTWPQVCPCVGRLPNCNQCFPTHPIWLAMMSVRKLMGSNAFGFWKLEMREHTQSRSASKQGKKNHYTCSEEYGLFRWVPQRTVNTTAPQKWKVTPLCHFESGHSSSLKFSSKITQVSLISIKILMTSRQNGSSGRGAYIQTLEPKSDHRKSRDGRTNPTTTSHSLTRCTLWHSLYTVTKWIR